MNSSDEIELTFIRETLKRFGYRLQTIFTGDIKTKRLIESGVLKGGIKYDVRPSGRVGAELVFYFPDYGRFIEIHFHKSSDNGFKAFQSKNKASMKPLKKFKSNGSRKKDTRWYAKNAYGYLNSLIGELMYGFSDEVQTSIREQILKN